MDSRILNHDIKISVVMPVYNTEKYVKRCVESVLQQTYRNIELIIVDDCSPGNIKEIAQYFANADSRVQIISHEKNKGLFRARLTGAEHATGEYIAFIDSDDYVTNDYYHTLLEKAETQKADIAMDIRYMKMRMVGSIYIIFMMPVLNLMYFQGTMFENIFLNKRDNVIHGTQYGIKYIKKVYGINVHHIMKKCRVMLL